VPVLILAGWPAVAAYLLTGSARTRGEEFELSLPLSARRIWLDDLKSELELSTVLLVFLSLWILGIALLAPVGPLRPAVPVAAFFLVSGTALAATLLQAPDLDSARVDSTPGTVLWMIGVVVAVPALLVFLTRFGPAAALLPLALAAIAGSFVWARIPASFNLVRPEPEASRKRAEVAAEAEPAPTASIVTRAILGSTTWDGESTASRWLATVSALLFAGLGAFALGGGLESVLPRLGVAMPPMTTLALFLAAGPRIGKLYRLDALPIRRSRIFRSVFLPPLAVFAACWGAGALLSSAAPSPVLPILLVLGCAPALLLLAAFWAFYRSRWTDIARMRIFSAVWFGTWMWWQFPFSGGHHGANRPPGAVVEIPASWIGNSLPALAATWIVAAAVLAGSYRIAQKEFERMELPPQPSSVSFFRTSWPKAAAPR
jgi:hypothetical protein